MASVADGADRKTASHKEVSSLHCSSTCTRMTNQFIQTPGDDLCIASQKQSFEEVEEPLSDALADLIPYYAANHL